jgi:hypothetical protein
LSNSIVLINYAFPVGRLFYVPFKNAQRGNKRRKLIC